MKLHKAIIVLGLGVLLLGASNSLIGCSTIDQTPVVARSGPQLWAENCQRCHNFRAPGSLSDGAWEVALAHMRLRANLTAVEHDKILAFLKASN